MSQIILPGPQSGSPFAPFNLLGFLHSGNWCLQISSIDSMIQDESGKLTVNMRSGQTHSLDPEAAKIFLADVNEFVKGILQQMQRPQVLGVPPGAQLPRH